jgi:hypothetical protein
MGGSISTHCRNCNHTEEFITGIGFSYFSLEKVIQFTTGNTRTKLQDIVSNHVLTDADYEHRVLACPSCNTLHERFYIKVVYDEGKVFGTKFRCGKCRVGLAEMDKPVEGYCCGSCGRKSLEEFLGINWD